MDAATLFESTMDWLRERGTRGFSKEADLVQAVQARIGREIETKGLHYRTAKERILVGGRADLVILDGQSVAVAAEFKYEPARDGAIASDDVVDWREVEADIQKIRKYVGKGGVAAAYAILIDADDRWIHRHPNPPDGSEWRDWGNSVSALWTKVGGDSSA